MQKQKLQKIQVLNFASGKYAFVTQGSWIGATITGDDSDAYSKAGSFKVGMIPYAFEEGMDTILTSAQKILVDASPFVDCKYVASDPFAPVISEYISAGKTSSWHWMEMAEGLGQNGFSYVYQKYANSELDAEGFLKEFKKVASDWYSKL